MKIGTKNNSLQNSALLVLFGTSYTPLFVLIALRQIVNNANYLNYAGVSIASVKCFINKFGLAIFLILLSIAFCVGLRTLLKNIHKRSSNGHKAQILKINNRNNEALGYIATYIVPFVSADSTTGLDVICFIVMMLIVYGIYVRSNMVLINPILNLKYSLYEIEYKVKQDKERDGLVLVKGHSIEEDEKLVIYPIGFKLFYGKPAD